MVKPGGVVAIVDEVEHPDVWLGFEQGQVEGFFRVARLTDYGYEPLGMQ
ncbi:MAG TPA: hypothetical protein VF068_04960 [Rubrobacter sp.]